MPGPLIFVIQILAAFFAFTIFTGMFRRYGFFKMEPRLNAQAIMNLVAALLGIVVAVFVYRFVGEWLS